MSKALLSPPCLFNHAGITWAASGDKVDKLLRAAKYLQGYIFDSMEVEQSSPFKTMEQGCISAATGVLPLST